MRSATVYVHTEERRRLWAALVALVAMCVLAPVYAGSGDDPAELARTWRHAWVFVPLAASAGYERVTTGRLRELLRRRTRPLPVVVYAHGCAGLNEIAARTGRFLARAGYLVIQPDGFARRIKPISCVPADHRGGLHRAVLGWRHAEVRYAMRKTHVLPEVRDDALFLMGLSEGGIAVATLHREPEPVAGRVIEGWTCHAGWPEYRGLGAPQDEPVLALVGADDPWFRLPVLRGDCGEYMQGRPQSRSIVFRAPNYLHDKHWLSFDPGVQGTIVRFLERYTPGAH